MNIYNSGNACIIYVEKRKYIYLAIEGYIDTQNIKAFANSLIQACKTYNVQSILFDTSKITIIKTDDLKWITDEVIPSLRNSNIKKVAFLTSENSFGNLSIKQIADNIKENDVNVFDKIEEAENWLFNPDISLDQAVHSNVKFR